MYFELEKLDVYQATLEFIAMVDEVVSQLPKGYAHRRSQLLRSADSIADNLAEGVGEFAANDRRRLLRISRRSGLEAASQLLVIRKQHDVDQILLEKAVKLLHRIVSMLTVMSSRARDRRSS